MLQLMQSLQIAKISSKHCCNSHHGRLRDTKIVE